MEDYGNQIATEWWETNEAPETITRVCVESDFPAGEHGEAFTSRSIYWCSTQEEVDRHKGCADRVLGEQTFKLN